MNATRRYSMDVRARAVEATRIRIHDATTSLASERRIADISLNDIAERAGVSVRTILRQFGSKDGLIRATAELLRRAIVAERAVPSGDLDIALTTLVDHYERHGQLVLLLLSQESSDPLVEEITREGKRLHRTWVTEVFSTDHEAEITDLLVVATDIYAWKLLRLDRRLKREQAEERMKSLVRAVLASSNPTYHRSV